MIEHFNENFEYFLTDPQHNEERQFMTNFFKLKARNIKNKIKLRSILKLT